MNKILPALLLIIFFSVFIPLKSYAVSFPFTASGVANVPFSKVCTITSLTPDWSLPSFSFNTSGLYDVSMSIKNESTSNIYDGVFLSQTNQSHSPLVNAYLIDPSGAEQIPTIGYQGAESYYALVIGSIYWSAGTTTQWHLQFSSDSYVLNTANFASFAISVHRAGVSGGVLCQYQNQLSSWNKLNYGSSSSSTVSVNNFPSTQLVSGSVSVNNLTSSSSSGMTTPEFHQLLHDYSIKFGALSLSVFISFIIIRQFIYKERVR